jgi:hypothetical protein
MLLFIQSTKDDPYLSIQVRNYPVQILHENHWAKMSFLANQDAMNIIKSSISLNHQPIIEQPP